MTATTDGASAASTREARLLTGEGWEAGEAGEAPVLDKYRLQPAGTVHLASTRQAGRMVDIAARAFAAGAPVAHARGDALARAAAIMAARRQDFVDLMIVEAGFTGADANGEVTRCIETLRLSGEEARRLAGEIIPVEGAPGQTGRTAFTLRVPIGIVAAITPFNSPLNTVAHKVAPAFAAGNAVIVKPASGTPLTACLLAEVLLEAGVPSGFVSVLHGRREATSVLLGDQRIRFFAFTGSTGTGRLIQAAAGLRRTQMELGSIACTIVNDDADLDRALPRIVDAGYRKAGQVCTSVQMLLVHDSRRAEVEERLTPMVSALRYGDPADPQTAVGPVISEPEARRIEAWVDEAVAHGGRRLAGGERRGAVVPPTLLADVTARMKVGCEEIFGPVVNVVPFSTLDEAIARVNATPYGLAAGIFTGRLADAFIAARRLQVGGVHVNETSSARVDMMPYGGSKDSGFGREGPHYAIREMTEERVVSISGY